jgi:hypothetical protein
MCPLRERSLRREYKSGRLEDPYLYQKKSLSDHQDGRFPFETKNYHFNHNKHRMEMYKRFMSVIFWNNSWNVERKLDFVSERENKISEKKRMYISSSHIAIVLFLCFWIYIMFPLIYTLWQISPWMFLMYKMWKHWRHIQGAYTRYVPLFVREHIFGLTLGLGSPPDLDGVNAQSMGDWSAEIPSLCFRRCTESLMCFLGIE